MCPQCVICFSAPAIMQTFPCGHKVVCRRCFVKTIQMAVCQRCLPLRCVVCRDKILRLNNTLPHHSPSTAKVVTPSFFTPPLSKSSRLSIGPLLTINLLHKPWKTNNFSFLARHSPKSKPESKIPAVESTTRISVADSHKDSSDRDCDIETLVSSHSDTFTRNLKTRDLRQQTPDIKQQTPDIKQQTPDFRCCMKSNDPNDKTLNHDVLRGHHCKIHPESSKPVYSFLDSNQAVGGLTSLSSATPNLNKATKFFSKFWPRSSRHKQTLALKKD
ncbi:serine/threonine-protein kinase [Biomphalaria pfeifferi]|uniref:Serine/threonine-protein kinase n=1 Tax=Biomphalaria pfeifferi TaxID=112525 RepID=A0AAD8FN77_BIOPF|nr:serine/threonine-protein kinase [Biomphalaria pfeifferi]